MTEEHIDNPSEPGHDGAYPDQEGQHIEPTLTAPRRRRRWPVVAFVLSAALIAAGLFIPLPYTTHGPGDLWETEQRITLEGQQAYTSEGAIRYASVSVRHAGFFELVRAWFDETIETRKYEETYPSGDREAERIINQKAMDDAKLVALFVASERLGIPVGVTGDGAFVEGVIEDMAAAGVLQQGDVITAVDGAPVEIRDDLTSLLGDKKVGDRVTLTVRDPLGEISTENLTLGENPEVPDRGFLGVIVDTSNQDLDLPFEVELDSGRVTGPSAGLAWTLGVIDRLTPEDITGGDLVAATGTISIDGSVGRIGGIVQKVKAAINDKADIFFYPAATDPEELEEAQRIAGDDLEMVGVANVDEALDELLDGQELEPVEVS